MLAGWDNVVLNEYSLTKTALNQAQNFDHILGKSIY
jgi:hypothetical protein